MGPRRTTTYIPASADIFRSESSGWGLELSECLCHSANVCGAESQGAWVGIAVTRETGVCLPMVQSGRCVCSGDAANQSSVFDPGTNRSATPKPTAWRGIASRLQARQQRRRANKLIPKQFSSLVYSGPNKLLTDHLVRRRKCACARVCVRSLAMFSAPRSLSHSTKQIASVTNPAEAVMSLRLACLSATKEGRGDGERRNCSTLDVSLGNLLCHQTEPMKLPRFSFPKVAAVQ